MKLSYASGFYHSPAHQSFVLESQCPKSYSELKERIKKMSSDTVCNNVFLTYSNISRPKGHPVEERVSFRCPQMAPEQLLEMVDCVTPSAYFVPSSEKAQKCLERICPKVT